MTASQSPINPGPASSAQTRKLFLKVKLECCQPLCNHSQDHPRSTFRKQAVYLTDHKRLTWSTLRVSFSLSPRPPCSPYISDFARMPLHTSTRDSNRNNCSRCPRPSQTFVTSMEQGCYEKQHTLCSPVFKIRSSVGPRVTFTTELKR